MKKTIFIIIIVIIVFIVNKVSAYTEYKIGDPVTYNGEDYYVIENSGTTESTVKLLKATPLTAEEITTYSAGTGATTDGNGGMQYHASSSAYNGSYVKTTVDAWKAVKAPAATEARLITIDEVKNLGYEWYDNGSAAFWQKTENTPSWVYNGNYWYWTMSPYNDSSSGVWGVHYDGELGIHYVDNRNGVVRPVIVLSKTSLGDEDESIIDEDNNETIIPNSNENKDATIKVNVPNTYMKASIIIIVLGIISAGIGVFIYYKKSNKKK